MIIFMFSGLPWCPYMRDCILNYLMSIGCPQTSDQILGAVLKIRSPNAANADRVLLGILGDDPRFCFEDGAWSPRASRVDPAGESDTHAIALFIQRPEAGFHPMSLRGSLYRRDTGELLEFDLTRSLQGLDVKSLRRWHAEAERHLLVVWSRDMVRLWNLLLRGCRLERQQGCILCLRSLAARALSHAAREIHPESLAAELGLPSPDSDRPAKMAQFISACLETLLDLVPEEQRTPAMNLVRWVENGVPRVDFSHMGFGKDFLRQLPESPGVYVMRNRAADILYVGKAANLRRRVASYFTPTALEDSKTKRIHEQLYSLEAIPAASELDALLLETQMIRDFRPPVNFQIEIHEQPAAYGKGRNLVLLTARPENEKAQAYFLRDGVFVGQQSVRLGRPAPRSLRTRIRTIYFPVRGRGRKSREPWEMEIVSRWLARHRRQINFVDVDEAGSYESAVCRLDWYLRDPDKLSKKVLYR